MDNTCDLRDELDSFCVRVMDAGILDREYDGACPVIENPPNQGMDGALSYLPCLVSDEQRLRSY